jgi:hypothetical protein|tara:strand:- start:20 stop:487 length:468 start_codon:yes stop_codon:yes gene_type:complete
MEKSINVKVFELHDSGVKAGKIAQKLRIKKTVVLDILGEAGKSEGLGDVITKITEVTGIKSVVESMTDDCGCAARAEKLNDLFPNRKLNDLSIDDFDFLTGLFAKPLHSVNRPIQLRLVSIFNAVFNSKREVSNCSPCVAAIVSDLKKVYERANN